MLVKKGSRLVSGNIPGDLEIYDRLCVPVFAVGADFRIVLINEKASELTGYSREDAREKKLFDIAAPGDLKSRMLRMFKGRSVTSDFSADGMLVTRNGRIRKVEWHCRIRYDGTIPAGAIVTFVDRTGAGMIMELARIMSDRVSLEEAACRFMDVLSDPLNLKMARISINGKDGEPLAFTRAYPHGGVRKEPQHALRDSHAASAQAFVRAFPLEFQERKIGELELKTYGGAPLMAEDEADIGRLCGVISSGLSRMLAADQDAVTAPAAVDKPAAKRKDPEPKSQENGDSRDMIKHLMGMLPHGVIMYNRDSIATMINDAAGRILGMPAHELEGQMATAIAKRLRMERESGTPVTRRNLATCRALRTGNPALDVRSTIVVNGWRRMINTSAMPIRNTAGEVTGCMTTVRDVTALESIVRLGRMAVNERNVNDLIEESLDVILNASGLRLASLYLWDGNTLKLKVQKGDGAGMPVPVCMDEPDSQNPSIQSRVYLSGKPLIIKDYRCCASVRLFDPLARKRPVQSMAGIPLRTDRGVIGVLVVATGENQPLADTHMTELSAMCSQLAAGIDRALRLDM